MSWVSTAEPSSLHVARYHRRDLTSVLDTDHNLTLSSSVNISTPQDAVFDDSTSCLLWPNIEPLAEGPYCEWSLPTES